jgi:hypothetical protein
MAEKADKQKRNAIRIPASLVVKFLHHGSICYGLITDLSENGMRINSGVCLPSNSSLKLLLPLKEEVLELPVKVRRLVETDAFYDIMGVEVLKPPQKYIQIVDSFKSAYGV